MSDQSDAQRPETSPQPEAASPAQAAPSPEATPQAQAAPPWSATLAEAPAPKPLPTRAILIVLAVIAAMIGVWAISGRRYQARPSGDSAVSGRVHQQVWNEELLPIAMDKFNRLEEFVEAEMLNQAIDQFDQWIQGQKPLEGWQVDPMMAAQPQLMSALPELKELDKLSFSRADILALQEAVLMRDVSAWARGEQVDDLERAKQLFDWTVRNVQLVASHGQPIQRPFETLVLGSGTVVDRAWLFILLCRQQGLDAVMLAIRDPLDPSKQRFGPWAPAVLIGKSLYPFMVNIGLPIPGPKGIKRNEAGQLDIQPATLSQLVADESLLGQLSVDPKEPYVVKAADLKRVVALIEASPPYLTQRLKMIESRLAGKDKLVLSTAPSALAARLKTCEHVADVQLWMIPYELIVQRMQNAVVIAQWQQLMWAPFYVGRSPWLMKGRILHLKGKLTGEMNAPEMYQHARPSDREMDAANMDTASRVLYRAAKINASYWLGLVAMEQGNHRAAIDYFAKRTLEATPGGPWTHGAKYNLGRVYEAKGEMDKAYHEYESDITSPAFLGNLLRSRFLGSKTAHLPPALLAKPASPKKPEAKPGEKPTPPAAKSPDKPAEKKAAPPEKPAPPDARPAEKKEKK